MNIATIQKRKFLNNIYKLLYSSGSRPSEDEVRKIFNSYFSINKLGQPIAVDYDIFNRKSTLDPFDLNELMVKTLLNMEVLYDCTNENSYEMMSVITALNKKLTTLKARRREVESKVDELLFSVNNSDGFFYSYLENFSSTKEIDLSLTSAFVDINVGNVTIPKINSGVFDMISSSLINPSNVTVSVDLNGAQVIAPTSVSGLENIMDGLTDTYWSYKYQSHELGVASLIITIPVNSNYVISKIEGTLLTSSSTGVIIVAKPVDRNFPDQNIIKDSRSDYDRFAFNLNPVNYSTITITLFKTFPDEVLSNSDKPYVYNFGLRDIYIGSKYHDKSAVIVSQPISIPEVDNGILSIESVSLSVQQQIGPGYDVSYFVAADVPNPSGLDSFNWIAVDAENASTNSNPTIVNLQSSNKLTRQIYDGASSYGGFELLDLNSDSNNVNERNPNDSVYSGKTVYRICNVGAEEIYQPFILNGLNSFRNYGYIRSSSSIESEYYKSLNIWSQKISSASTEITETTPIQDQLSSISPGFNSICSGLLECKISCDRDNRVIHTVSKSREDFSLAIYLNDVLIADLPVGTASKDIEWSFKTGINYIKIAYDKNFEGLITFNIMSGRQLSDYGTVFLDYYSYLDPYEFRQRVSESNFIFTIDSAFGAKELLASRHLKGRSQITYYGKKAESVKSIRYRADLYRDKNPLVSPIIDSVRVKFRHNEEG